MRTPSSSVLATCALAVTASACTIQSTPAREPEVMTPAAGTGSPRVRPGAGCSENFTAFDSDGDDRVSKGEFTAQPHVERDPAAWFDARDANGNGELTRAEFCSRSEPRPEGDQAPAQPRPKGTLKAGAAAETRQRQSEGQSTKAGMGAGMAQRRGHMAPGARCENHFEMYDANSDGKMSEAEFSAWPHARGEAATLFSQRDQDDDGTLTQAEFCSAPKGPPQP